MPETPHPNDPARPSRIVHSAPGIGAAGGAVAPTSAAPVPPGSLASAAGTAPPAEAAPPAGAPGPAAPAGAPGAPGAATTAPPGQKIIRNFGDRKRHEDSWSRTPNTTGTGAIHVKTFHCKLTDESLVFLDQTINEWLDAHPQYEVKFVSSSIGDFTSKLREPHLMVQVWV